jgi:hypothetical protein
MEFLWCKQQNSRNSICDRVKASFIHCCLVTACRTDMHLVNGTRWLMGSDYELDYSLSVALSLRMHGAVLLPSPYTRVSFEESTSLNGAINWNMLFVPHGVISKKKLHVGKSQGNEPLVRGKSRFSRPLFLNFVRSRFGNFFFIRRGPGPNKFTRKYLSNFFL